MSDKEFRRALYFIKQKSMGVLLLLLTALAVKVLNGDATVAIITVPIALMLIFSKRKIWTDRYYFETEDES